MRVAVWAVALSCLLSCDVDIPEGVFKCVEDTECPEGWSCDLNGFCVESLQVVGGSGGSCTPGEPSACTCPGGESGVRYCGSDGKWGKCGPCTGEAAGSGGAGGLDTARQCLNQVPAAVPTGCRICLCERCTQQTLACDDDCWSLILCAIEKCPGIEQGCVVQNCPMQNGMQKALDIVSCSDDCRLTCGS